MSPIVRKFLLAHEVGCISTEINDGLHSAAIHYTLTDQGTFYIQTNLDSRKCLLLKESGEVKAALVVGLSTEEWKTYQANGTARLITDPVERRLFASIRGKQFSGKNYADDPEVAFIEFSPIWSRYTDSNTKPKTIIEN